MSPFHAIGSLGAVLMHCPFVAVSTAELYTGYVVGFVRALHIYLNSLSMCIALIKHVHSIYLVSGCVSGENCK